MIESGHPDLCSSRLDLDRFPSRPDAEGQTAVWERINEQANSFPVLPRASAFNMAATQGDAPAQNQKQLQNAAADRSLRSVFGKFKLRSSILRIFSVVYSSTYEKTTNKDGDFALMYQCVSL